MSTVHENRVWIHRKTNIAKKIRLIRIHWLFWSSRFFRNIASIWILIYRSVQIKTLGVDFRLEIFGMLPDINTKWVIHLFINFLFFRLLFFGFEFEISWSEFLDQIGHSLHRFFPQDSLFCWSITVIVFFIWVFVLRKHIVHSFKQFHEHFLNSIFSLKYANHQNQSPNAENKVHFDQKKIALSVLVQVIIKSYQIIHRNDHQSRRKNQSAPSNHHFFAIQSHWSPPILMIANFFESRTSKQKNYDHQSNQNRYHYPVPTKNLSPIPIQRSL